VIRIKKARGSSICPACRGSVTPGQPIGRLGGVWLHVVCIADRLRRCEHCGHLVAASLVEAGTTTHPMCEGLPEGGTA
jgi:hypothetical protein